MKMSLKEFRAAYGTHEQCLEAIKQMRFPDPYSCLKCNTTQKFYPVTGRTAYACNNCGHHIYPLAGTIFEKSTTPLDYWFFGIYLMTQTRCGISAKQLERMLGTTYKTAFRMFHLIRRLMEDNPELLTGVVEIDEAFFGGSVKNRRYAKNFGEKPKDIIMGFVQRDGKAVMKMIPTTGKYALLEKIQKHVDPKATIMHDEWGGYTNLHKYGFDHHAVNHGKEFVREKVIHTENIEGLWGRIKPAIKGTYRKVSAKYLEAYMNEFCFRYNHRKEGGLMFDILLRRAALVRA